MNIDQVFQEVRNKPHGGSPTGMSHYRAASTNGRQANLKKLQPGKEWWPDQTKVHAATRGTCLHALLEHCPDPEGEFTFQDIHFAEALRVYRAFHSRFGTPSEKYGASEEYRELSLPTPDAAPAVEAEMGGPLTGRLDLLVYIQERSIHMVEHTTGLALPGEGWYIIDYKTAGKTQDNDTQKYEDSLQAQAYMFLFQKSFPDRVLRGVIFDQIVCTKNVSFEYFFVDALLADPAPVRNVIKIALRNIAEDLCIPDGCSGYGGCYWRRVGLCKGY